MKGLKVVELAGVLAGPSAGLFFAELGAKVIKIENKLTGGDVTRGWKLPGESKSCGVSAYFLSVNFLKKHLFLDLRDKVDYKKCLGHIRDADIAIVNYKKGDDKKLGLDFATLRKINPWLIYASITGFSETDERVAYDLVMQAETGFMSMNGTAQSGPLKMPVALIDLLAAHQLKEAILLALLKRSKTGKGSRVSVSLFDAAVSSLANQASNWLVAKHLPQRTGSLHPNIAPYGEIFKTSDDVMVTFAIGTDKQFADLCSIVGSAALATNKNFLSNQLRVKNRKRLFSLLNKAVRECTFKKIESECTARRVPYARVRNLKEVFELPLARKLLRNVDAGGKTVQVVTSFVARGL